MHNVATFQNNYKLNGPCRYSAYLAITNIMVDAQFLSATTVVLHHD